MICLHQPLRLVLDPDSTRTLCALVLIVEGGAASDTIPGLTYLTLEWWVKTSLQHLPAQLDWRVEADFCYLGLICHPNQVEQVLEGLVHALHIIPDRPSAFEEMQAHQLKQFMQETHHPQNQLIQILRQEYLGPSPGTPVKGTAWGLRNITLPRVLQHHKTFQYASRLLLTMGGNFNPSSALGILESNMGSFITDPYPLSPVSHALAKAVIVAHENWQGFVLPVHPPGHEHHTQDQLAGQMLWENPSHPIKIQWKGNRHRWGAFVTYPKAHATSLERHAQQLRKGIPHGQLDQAIQNHHTRLLLQQSSLLAHTCRLATSMFFSQRPKSIEEEVQHLQNLSCCQVHAQMMMHLDQLENAYKNKIDNT